jgi:uncharacterized membrane protein
MPTMKRRVLKPRRPSFEVLEARTMLDGAFGSTTPAIIVGRVQSTVADSAAAPTTPAYFVGDIQSTRQITITYTAYNEQTDPETGVLLTTRLAPGVTIASASQLPDQSGQDLAWSLGTIQGFDRASVSVTLNLPAAIPLRLDSGAHVYAMLDAGAVTNVTAAAALRPGSLSDPALLASTPDANTTDPYIQEEAAALNYDPQQIFNFVHTQIGYNSYLGSVRGARGTLWSSAGNALDVASLGVALMRASGIPAQYESGTLSQSQAQQLILSMFPASYQAVGYIPAGTQVSDPANDPQLLSETESHYWFQFNTGSGMQDADPLMPGATIGQAFTTATGTFTEVPDAMRAKTEITLKAELYFPGESAIIGALGQLTGATGIPGTSTSVVLDQTFNDVDLVGRPITIGNFVDQGEFDSQTPFSPSLYTYSFYIDMSDDAYPDGSHDHIIRGQDYQEIFSSNPLANQILTGLFLNVTLTGSDGSSQSFERTLVDRIGFAARQGLESPSISLGSDATPALSGSDVFTLVVGASQQSTPAVGLLTTSFQSLLAQVENLAGSDEPDTPVTPFTLMTMNELEIAQELVASDAGTTYLQNAFSVKAYRDKPSITVASSTIDPSSGSLSDEIDLLSDSVRTVVFPGQNVIASFSFNEVRGLFDNTIEEQVLQSASGMSPVGTLNILQAATSDGIPLTVLTSSNPAALNDLGISTDAKARITQAIEQGSIVIVPSAMVNLGGQPTIGWIKLDASTGELTGVLEDGSHGVIIVPPDPPGTTRTKGGILAPDNEYFALLQQQAVKNQSLAVTAQRLQKTANFINKWLKYIGIGVGGTVLSKVLKKVTIAFLEAVGTNSEFLLVSGFGKAILALLEALEPPLFPLVANPFTTFPTEIQNTDTAPENEDSLGAPGGISASVHTPNLSVLTSGPLAADWTSTSASAFQLASLSTPTATVTDSGGDIIGTGTVSFLPLTPVRAVVSGNNQYTISGTGGISFYGPAESTLGVSANWDNYSAAVTGNISITLNTKGLVLRDQMLPAGTYTITTNTATLTGSGSTSSPNFAGSVSISTTGATIKLGPGTGSLYIGGNPVDADNETTLDGYSGTISVSTNGDGTDSVSLNGNAANSLRVTVGPTPLTTDQNTSITFQPEVETSLSDTYTLTANAPPGWTVAIDASGDVTATPPPGLQSGLYPIQIIAQSQTDSNLEAQTTVLVTITATQPGINFSVTSDPLITIPVNGAPVPTAFRATIQNLGPAADTYNLTFSNIPSGFTLLDSGTTVTVPAGQTGILGIYVQPNAGQPLPAPGTPLTFTVKATSTSNPSITSTQTVSFTMPEVHALSLTTENPTQDVVPGSEWGFTVDLRNDGNVTENVQPTASLPAGLSLPGGFFSLHNATLAPGQSVSETATHTADASLPLNSTQTVTVTASYGPVDAPLTQSVQMSVQMILPGAFYAGNLGIVAGQLGRTDLANRLGDLSTALTNLFLDPSNAVDKSQALADLDSIIGQLADDPFLAGAVTNLTASRGTLAGATTADQVQNASNQIGGELNFAFVLSDEDHHRFTLALSPNTAVAQPGAPIYYKIALRNTGTQPTTYDFFVFNPPAGLKFTFSQPSITLQPGQAIAGGDDGVTLAVTETGNALVAAGFNVTAIAEGAGEIKLDAPGTVTLRPAFVSVPEVDASPPFTDPGNPVDVSAKVLNAVNQEQQALASFTVSDAGGSVVFTSQRVPLTLTVQTSLVTVDLGRFDTTGLATGSYVISVTVTDSSGNPIPGATGEGRVLLGSPVTAALSISPTTSLPGSATVTNTLQLTAQTSFPDPLTLVGQVQTTPVAGSVALHGDIAYVAGTNGIDIVDISNPAAPVDDGTFAADLIVKGGHTVARVVGDELIVGSTVELNPSSFKLLIYSLADPLNPQLISQTPINYVIMNDLIIHGSTILATTSGADYFAGVFSFQFGSLVSLDVSDPAKPVLKDALFNDRGSPDGGDTNQDGGAIINDQIAYIASSTSSGGVRSGVGRVLVVDYSQPTNLSVLGEVDIPGTVHAVGVAIQGDRALVVGNTGDWSDLDPPGSLTGTLTLSVLDTSDPTNPKLLGTTLFTDGSGGGRPVPLGNGLFAISQTGADGKPQLLVVDPTDPDHIVVTAISTPAPVNEMSAAGDLLYTTSSAGLEIYQIGSVVGEQVTASIQVPTGAGVAVAPGSFNVPPTRVLHGTDHDTLVWDRVLAFGESSPTFTWKSTVSNLLPGEARDVTQGGTVEFVNQGTTGALTLPPTAVSGVHFIQMDPASQTVRPGETVTFHITLDNPSSLGQEFHLSVAGVPANWVSLQPTDVGIDGNGSTSVTLKFTPNVTAELGDYGFHVAAGYGFGDASQIGAGTDGVNGTLTVAGSAPVPSYLNAHGVTASITPAQATAGQGTPAVYIVRLINTGSVAETFALAAALPTGVAGTFSQNVVDVPPGVTNFRDVQLTLTPAAGTTPGDIAFTVTATSTTTPATATASGKLTVVENGVAVTLDKTTGSPGDTLQATVTNTGTVADTFDVAVAGPAGLVASLAATKVMLDPGQSQTIAVTTGAVNFAVPGVLNLLVSARSEGNGAVQSSATAALQIGATTGLTASLDPDVQVLPVPGSTDFLLLVNNIGNIEDSYSATITSASGPVTAALGGLDGSLTQTIPIFRLPGLSSGAILLHAAVSAGDQQGTVAVRIQSTTNAARMADVTARISANTIATTTTLHVSPTSASQGDPITLIAEVQQASGSNAPTGTVTFLVDGAAEPPVALQTVGGAASATLVLTSLGVGPHHVAAVYSGDASFSTSRSATSDLSIAPSSHPDRVATTSVLSTSPNPASAGETITLSVAVVAMDSVAPSGSVTFFDGASPLGTVALDDSGHAVLRLPTSTSDGVSPSTLHLGIGSHTITAVYSGDSIHLGSTSAPDTEVVSTPETPGPLTVAEVQRYGFHWQPTVLKITFSAALDPASAQDPGVYQVFRITTTPKGVRRLGKPIAVGRASYETGTQSVVLDMSERLNIHWHYLLVIAGGAPGGLVGASGQRLAAKGGAAGSDFTTVISRGTLVGRVPSNLDPSRVVSPADRSLRSIAVPAAAFDTLAILGRLPRSRAPLHSTARSMHASRSDDEAAHATSKPVVMKVRLRHHEPRKAVRSRS